ncbi:MAG: TonB-dependent receptor [Alphaproteobacteria bacterium]|nr:TonB-dependent receptor [Alphaproteobacteria bacterium]
MFKKLLLVFPLVISFHLITQEASADNEVEEVITVGSQIKGASITGALPVTVLDADDIDAIATSDGDELINNLVEQGFNYFNEAEQISGGVNAARGDVGAYNLRSMGVGNTLVLLNGRRMVNNAGYQTEKIGDDFVPTMTVNSNLIPTNALSRLEVLKDGASAIYGADAVAGVVNNVLQTDYEGLRVSAKVSGYDHFAAQDTDLKLKYGTFLNNGRTNINVSLSHRDREKIDLTEDEKWANADYRRLIPEDSPWAGDSSFNNQYTFGMMQLDLNSIYGAYNKDPNKLIPPLFGWTDRDGETQLFPTGSPECSNAGAIDTGMGSCLVPDTNYYYSPSEAGRQYRGDMERTNLFIFINHEMNNGNEMFAEIGRYESDSIKRDNNGSFTAGIISIPADYYWFSQLPESSGISSNTKSVRIDGWRPVTMGRTTRVNKEDYRYLLGLRGVTESNWSWESAILYSRAKANDVTSGRISFPLFRDSLNNPSSAAFNIFDPNPKTNNSASVMPDVYRKDTSRLASIDYKISNPEVFELPAGPVGMLVGFEYRKESYEDNRDPLLDGTIRLSGTSTTNTYPFRSAVMGSSATGDTIGSKKVRSAFIEFQVPVTEKLNAQIASRVESFSDSKSAAVYKIALGYDLNDSIKLRGSTSTAFRAPNLVQVNQKEVARTGTRDDMLMEYISKENGQSVPTSGDIDGRYTVLRYAQGAEDLKPEESTNTSFGFVLTPAMVEGLTITVDAWSIEKENTIALFGRNNHIIADLLARIRGGSDCSAGNPAVIRNDASNLDEDETALFTNLGLCPVGKVDYVADEYLNLASREVEGTDVAIYYDFETNIGDFSITLVSTFTDTFYQTPTGDFSALSVAIASGELPAYAAPVGFGDINGTDVGAIEQKDRLKISYRRGDYRASLSALRIGDFRDSGETSAGFMYHIPSMTTADLSISKNIELGGNKARVKFVVKNIADERAPLADGYNGYFSDAHSDMGRNYYLDLRVDF